MEAQLWEDSRKNMTESDTARDFFFLQVDFKNMPFLEMAAYFGHLNDSHKPQNGVDERDNEVEVEATCSSKEPSSCAGLSCVMCWCALIRV